MKTVSGFLMAVCLVWGLFSCSEDDRLEKGDAEAELSGESVYMQVKLQFSEAVTRSHTDDQGDSNSDANADTEIGRNVENTVGEVVVLLADSVDQPIMWSQRGVKVEGAPTDLYTVRFDSVSLMNYADSTASRPIHVYVFCNPYPDCDFGTLEGIYQATVGMDEPIWKDNGFFMTNANDVDLVNRLPNRTELARYNTPKHPCNLGTIAVERTAARFDFARDSVHFTLKNALPNDTVIQEVKVDLKRMALFNMSKKCYDFRRVSADGELENCILCGKEMPGNYVIDTDAGSKTPGNLMYTDTAKLVWQSIDSLSSEEQWEDQTHGSPVPKYYVWRYATENTLAERQSQNKDVATGVVFEGILNSCKGCDLELQNEINTGTDPLYVFNNVLYGSWRRVDSAAHRGLIDFSGGSAARFAENPALANACDAVKSAVASGTCRCVSEAAEKLNLFSVFRPNDGKYVMYYMYWNRHNDNGNPEKSGPMEFAVVRNNVYKLWVRGITGFGLPDFELPNDPIEPYYKYFQVAVRVLPWAVRVNDIVF